MSTKEVQSELNRVLSQIHVHEEKLADLVGRRRELRERLKALNREGREKGNGAEEPAGGVVR